MAKGTGGATGLWQGKVGGFNYRIVNGKQIVSEFVIPNNPQTARQTEVRSINTELSRSWRDDLTQGNRNAWDQRAKQQGTKGELLFIKQNFHLLDFGFGKVIQPPAMVMPPELTDVTISAATSVMELLVPQLAAGIITQQLPFIYIEVAGGFTSAELDEEGPTYTAEISTEALSQGRIHQNSDFRHVLYVADKPIANGGEPSDIFVSIPAGTTRNVVLRIRRYNRWGNSSEVLIFDKIIAA